MAKFTLTIETNDPAELADITAAIAEDMARLAPGDTLTPEKMAVAVEAVERPTPSKRGRSAKSTAASAVEEIGGSPAEETPSASSPSTTASPSEETKPAPAGAEEVTAQDCRIALNAAMERGLEPSAIQAEMIAQFGGGSLLKIDPAKYPALKVFLEGLKK